MRLSSVVKIRLATAGSVLLAMAFSQSALAETGWQVVQDGDSCPMGPGTTVIVSSNAMRVSGARGRIVMMTSGPSWKVVLVNNQVHTMYQTTLDDWLRTAQQEKSRGTMEGATWKRGTTDQIARMRAYGFVMDHPPNQTVPVSTTKRRMTPVTAAQLWVAQDIATSPAISNLFSKLYGIPDCQRLPLRLATSGAGQPSSLRLDTVSAAPVAINASMFQTPAGYKLVPSYVDVITGSTDSDDIRKLLNE
jgi:hypothetical protein